MNDYEMMNNASKSNGYYGGGDDTVSVGCWILILIATAIPIVNIITTIALICSNNANLKNYGKAGLILSLIGFVLYVLVY
ncbi:hypothetical protein PV797_13730 [Clostridiaceae bacterium M8S5]|nr:hypothetical protein PV797_13730 [Clostridiaceae bacterium M8S5]